MKTASTFALLAATALTFNASAQSIEQNNNQASDQFPLTIPGTSVANYSFTAEADGPQIIRLDGDGAADLDLVLTTDDGQVIAESLGTDARERVRFDAQAGVTYRFQVRNIDEVESHYIIGLGAPMATFERDVAGNDHYVLDFPTRSAGVIDVMLVGQGNADIDLLVFDADENLIAISESYQATENLTFSFEADQMYYIVVKNLSDETSAFTLDLQN